MGILDKHNPEWEMWKDVLQYRKNYLWQKANEDSLYEKYKKCECFMLLESLIKSINKHCKRRIEYSFGIDEPLMWQDIFKFRKKYYIPPVKNDEWQKMLEEMYEIAGKYQNQPFFNLCKEVLLDVVDEAERSVRQGE